MQLLLAAENKVLHLRLGLLAQLVDQQVVPGDVAADACLGAHVPRTGRLVHEGRLDVERVVALELYIPMPQVGALGNKRLQDRVGKVAAGT